jgi:ABC-type nitrate/sulfonate/bicarbonate transport system substrate-binding protein
MRYLSSAITALWVAACLSPLPGVAEEKTTRINLGYSSISGSQAILRVTKDAGIFSKNGLDASLVLIAGGTGMIQALIAGDLPIAVVSGEPAILARLQGADTVILAGLINIIDSALLLCRRSRSPKT